VNSLCESTEGAELLFSHLQLWADILLSFSTFIVPSAATLRNHSSKHCKSFLLFLYLYMCLNRKYFV